MKKLLWLLPVLLVAGLVWWAVSLKNAPPEVRFTAAKVENLADALITNGKVEPLAWASVRAERAGRVTELRVEKGATVAAGAVLAQMETNELRSGLEAAQARVAQMQAEMQTLQRGGSSAALAEIDASVARLRVDKGTLEQELAATERLAAKKAVTQYEVTTLKDRVASLNEQIRGLQARRSSLVAPGDKASLEARLREAQAGVGAAQDRLGQSVLRSPIAGVVYQMDPKPGAYLNPGDLVANIGRVDSLRVNVYIDEPELGRVAVGMPVTITWDAKPGRQWQGTIEKLPVQIVALGNRQVGEVAVTIDNEGRDLPPGANINASVRSRTAANAIIIPKEALRRDNGTTGVYLLQGSTVVWRPVQTGISNVTHMQIVSGLQAGDRVALATDAPLKSGSPVAPTSEEVR